jgi:hypothetical protein
MRDTVKLLNTIRSMERFCGLAPLTEAEEDDRDKMFLVAALSKAEEEKA